MKRTTLGLFIVMLTLVFMGCQSTASSDAQKGSITGFLIEMNQIPQNKFPLFDKFKNGGPPQMFQTVDSFLIGKYEITQSQFESVMGYNNSRFIGAQRPKDQVSWYEAIVFCNLLSIKEGLNPVYMINKSTNPKDWGKLPESLPTDMSKWDPNSGDHKIWDQVICNWKMNGYRLPSEMEWRSVALNGYTGATFGEAGSLIEFVGDPNPGISGDNEDDYGWYKNNANDVGEIDLNYGSHIVGAKRPNKYGVYDLAGNVFEWCWDWVTGNGYQIGDEINYHGTNTGNGQKVRAGGSWAYQSYFVSNGGHEPWCKEGDAGFRVARTK